MEVMRPGKRGLDTNGMAVVCGSRGADSPKGSRLGTITGDAVESEEDVLSVSPLLSSSFLLLSRKKVRHG
jgi:hypothetical protein